MTKRRPESEGFLESGALQRLKTLSRKELVLLASEIRHEIIRVVSHNGGHLASNLGVVELTIALNRVFDSSSDRLVWDVGHQCYAHKLISGRVSAFTGLRRRGGLSGFPKISESPHDAFGTGHASTSISAALGLLAGAKLRGEPIKAVAIIGDGALTGGMAYEGLSHAGQLGLPLIVILNDNKMSISPNVGALSKYLSRLSMKARYQTFRRNFDSLVRRIPVFGETLNLLITRMKRGVKAVFFPDNFFVDLGFEYVGPIDGHNMPVLEQVLSDVKRLEKPVVVHVVTKKGKGFDLAEGNPTAFHGVSSFSVTEGLLERQEPANFTEAFGRAIVRLAKSDDRIAAVTAAMEKGTGLSSFHKLFPKRFFDVGIAEGHALTFAAGLSLRGARPIVAIYSTFLQRAMDQLIHDIALQNLPVIIALDRAGFVSDDGETHQGLFDIALTRVVPALNVLAPASALEMEAMLRWAIAQVKPVLIRYPKAACPQETAAFESPIIQGRGVFVKESQAPILLCFTGGLFPQADEAANILASDGIAVDLYNLRFIKPVDEAYMLALLDGYALTVVVEEGVCLGGFGEYLSGLIHRHSASSRLLCLGAGDQIPPQAERGELLEASGLSARGIADSVAKAYRRPGFLTVLRSQAR